MIATNANPSAEWKELEQEIARAASIIRDARRKLTNPAEIYQADKFAETCSRCISEAWAKANEPIGLMS
jgi:hypothetical protein